MTRPVRIAFLIIDLDIGGAERMLERLVLGLDRGRYEPLVVSLTSVGSIGPALARRGIPLLSLGTRGALDARAGLLLIRMLRRFRPDILQSSLFHANIIARLIAPLSRRPAVIATHHTLEGGRMHERMERWTWFLCHRIVAVSDSVRTYLTQACGIPAEGIRRIYDGVPLPRNSVRQGGIIATASRLHPGKGIDDAIRAADGLAPLRIIGDGPERDRLRSLAPSALFTGPVEDVTRHFDGVSILLHPSRLGEGLGQAMLEAMASGIPVVATDVGGTHEVVIDGVTGFLVPSGDVSALRSATERLVRDPALARRMGEAGRTRVREHFSLDQMIREYALLYDAMVQERS